jgi:polysaccharide biosynthesis/export protein
MLKQFACLLAIAFSLCAQEQKESLLIGPGDLVQIDVMDTPEMEQQVRVLDNGMINLAYLGDLKIAGLTPAAAAKKVQLALIQENVMRHPQVTVRIQESVSGAVSVLGEVKSPGTYSVTRPESILKVLSMAGGLGEMANRHIAIQRPGSANAITYFMSNDAAQAINGAVEVFPGDMVVVPKAPFIYIMGDVVRPGGYAITSTESRLTVLQAIAIAGSANKTSVESKVRLIRTLPAGGVEELPVRLDLIQKGKQPDVNLRPNDIIYVPFSWTKNIALNASSIPPCQYQ